jgi:cysteine desulfurase/selenocysteine lyase
LVAHSYAGGLLKPGDEIVVSIAEHHSNFVPWQQIAKVRGLEFKVVYLDEDENFSIEKFKDAISEKTKLVAITQLANALGLVAPVREIISLAHAVGAVAVVDAAQGLPHLSVDVQELNCDFLALSGHKIYGPSGIGVLYGKERLLDAMPPYQFGGEMIESVKEESTEFNILPYKFEAGTPNIAGAVGLGEALKYFASFDQDALHAHEEMLVRRIEDGLAQIDGVRVFGPMGQHVALVTFEVEGVHPLDLAEYLGQLGVAIRAGHHCAEPLMRYFGVNATARASLGIYNTVEDIDTFLSCVNRAVAFFRR